MIQGTDDTRYAFVNGIIRAREARFLTKGHFDRLIAGSLASIKTIISDSPYAGHDDLLLGCSYEERELKNFFDVYCMTPEVNKFVDWPEQIHNLKIKLKQGGDELLYAQPQSDVEQWPEIITEIEQFAFHKDPFRLSTNMDKTMCKYLFRAAQFVPFFSMYYRLYFDLENIRSFFRARQFENSKEIFSQVFIPYGSYDARFFIDNLKLGYEHLSKPFFTTPYIVMIEKGCVYLEENHSFLRLERLAEETRLGFLQQSRKMTFGVEPLFAYYHFKINEIKKIRQVYWGKLNGLPPNELKESIPDVW